MEGRFQRLATPLVAGVVVLVVAAAVAASLADGGGRPGATPAAAGSAATTTAAAAAADAVIGAVLRLPRPAPGRFSGTLFWDAADCSTGSLDLATGATATGLPAHACSLYAAPGGGAFAYTGQSRPGAARLSVLVRATGREHRGPVRGGSTAVSGDGHVATCGALQVLEQAPDGATRTEPGCTPAYAGDRLLRITPDEARAIDDAGRTVIPAGDGTLRMLAANGDVLATLRATGGLGGQIEVWRGGRRIGRREMGSSGQPYDVRVAPDGATVLVRLRGPQEWALYRTEREGSLAVIGQEGIQEGAFSPDGRYIAVVVESGVVIVDAAQLRPVAALPVSAKELAWLV